jgi:hypothetical protein
MFAIGVCVEEGYERTNQEAAVEEHERTPESRDCIVVDKPPGEEQPGTDEAQRIYNPPTLPGRHAHDLTIEPLSLL